MNLSLENLTENDFLPICSFDDCRKIRPDPKADCWISRVEESELYDSYLKVYSNGRLSHSICSDCMKKHYPQFAH